MYICIYICPIQRHELRTTKNVCQFRLALLHVTRSKLFLPISVELSMVDIKQALFNGVHMTAPVVGVSGYRFRGPGFDF
jgi:hypothetical protein